MDHKGIDLETAKGLKVLRERIDAAGIPPSKLDETINIATWNIREFGQRPRLKSSIHYIAEIIGQFDLVAIVEARANLGDLQRVMEILGPYWKAVFSDFGTDAGGNRERMVYVYDERAMVFTGLAAEADPPRKRVKVKDDPPTYDYLSKISWWRSPFMSSFRAGNFDFVVMSAHIRWGKRVRDRIPPLKMLAEWIDKRRKEKFVTDGDILLMGDFNITSRRSRTFKAITSKGLEIPPALLKSKIGTNLNKSRRYDQILHYPMHPSMYTDRKGKYRAAGGVLDFYAGNHRALFSQHPMTKRRFTYQLSDHLPLWFQLNIWDDDIVLDQIINRRRKGRKKF